MSNIKTLINKNNARIVNKDKPQENSNRKKEQPKRKPKKRKHEECNCLVETLCPLGNKCLQSSVVYIGEVQCKDKHNQEIEPKYYIGQTGDTFKNRWYSHQESFRKEGYKSTTLSSYIWKLKNKGLAPSVKWSIKSKAYSFSSGSKKCDLCLTEKLEILKVAESEKFLNHRDELLEKCRHMRKFMLGDFFKKHKGRARQPQDPP